MTEEAKKSSYSSICEDFRKNPPTEDEWAHMKSHVARIAMMKRDMPDVPPSCICGLNGAFLTHRELLLLSAEGIVRILNDMNNPSVDMAVQ